MRVCLSNRACIFACLCDFVCTLMLVCVDICACVCLCVCQCVLACVLVLLRAHVHACTKAAVPPMTPSRHYGRPATPCASSTPILALRIDAQVKDLVVLLRLRIEEAERAQQAKIRIAKSLGTWGVDTSLSRCVSERVCVRVRLVVACG